MVEGLQGYVEALKKKKTKNKIIGRKNTRNTSGGESSKHSAARPETNVQKLNISEESASVEEKLQASHDSGGERSPVNYDFTGKLKEFKKNQEGSNEKKDPKKDVSPNNISAKPKPRRRKSG